MIATAQKLDKFFKILQGVTIGCLIVATITIITQCHLSELSQIEGIQKVQVHTDLELGFLLIFFVLLLVSHIFEYGTSSQQLSDELL